MRKKIGTILDEELVFKAKRIALNQRQSLSQLLEEALKRYLQTAGRNNGIKTANIAKSTRGSMKASRKVLKAVIQEEGVLETGSY